MPIDPGPEQTAAHAALADDEPIVAVNLLKYREWAAYEEPVDSPDVSGRHAYLRYATVTRQLISQVGGGPVFTGNVALTFVGEPADDWDDIACIRYPSPKAMRDMTEMPAYKDVLKHRTAALERSVVLICRDWRK
ncbi:MAG: DUF1330 domain-containing protein [Alphaproteobacteria bacterium]|nr:DUF1330 domain-containing protein [Alphaproteobacteria bacterium]